MGVRKLLIIHLASWKLGLPWGEWNLSFPIPLIEVSLHMWAPSKVLGGILTHSHSYRILCTLQKIKILSCVTVQSSGVTKDTSILGIWLQESWVGGTVSFGSVYIYVRSQSLLQLSYSWLTWYRMTFGHPSCPWVNLPGFVAWRTWVRGHVRIRMCPAAPSVGRMWGIERNEVCND